MIVEVVTVWFQEKWCPIKLDRCIILLNSFQVSLTPTYTFPTHRSPFNTSRYCNYTYMLTLALKMNLGSCISKDFACCGIDLWRRQTMEENWPRLSESPTKIIVFPRSFSSINVALKLWMNSQVNINELVQILETNIKFSFWCTTLARNSYEVAISNVDNLYQAFHELDTSSSFQWRGTHALRTSVLIYCHRPMNHWKYHTPSPSSPPQTVTSRSL